MLPPPWRCSIMVRIRPFHGRDQGSIPCSAIILFFHAEVAQVEEQWSEEPRVGCASQSLGTI